MKNKTAEHACSLQDEGFKRHSIVSSQHVHLHVGFVLMIIVLHSKASYNVALGSADIYLHPFK